MDNSDRAGSNTPLFIEAQAGHELTELVPPPQASVAVEPRSEAPDLKPATTAPEFDAYMAVVELLVGGAVEGLAELADRVAQWQAEQTTPERPPAAGAVAGDDDEALYLLVGMALAAGAEARRRVRELVHSSDRFWRRAGQAAKPLADSRLTSVIGRPLDRALRQLASRSQQQMDDWIALGQAHEPGMRRMARDVYTQIIDDFISNLAENQELADLVQKKSVGLAAEAVDELRSRTVSADAMAEGLIRRVLRRPPRTELPAPSEDFRQRLVEKNTDAP